ncbi:MAG TPA: hypothetical protein VL354_18680, partial [Spirochaetia bacterium]|nr:hypothetical protein [Spirochaetia bacterium]
MKGMLQIGNESFTKPLALVGCAALGVLVLVSCTTINRLGEFEMQGHTMAVDMRLPPEPEMDVHYHIHLDPSDLIGSAINVGSNMAKAANADRVEALMRQALDVVDVPGMVRDESYSTCLSVLETQQEDDPNNADYLLDFDIHKWGVHASSWTSEVSLRMKLTAYLYQKAEKTIVWRRDIEVERPATAAMFGLPSTIGNFVTSAALASLSEEDLQNGFDQLARDTALAVSRTLQNDLYDARY